jgi:nitrate reductase gamma subunit
MNSLLWMIAPYVALTSFVLGHIWRYRADQFGWTTRSSQIYESRLLRMGSPLFHFGLLGVFGGYVVGLMIPESWTAAVGISEWVYHLMAVTMGSLAGFAVVTGLGILLYRRITVLAVAKATTRRDKLMADAPLTFQLHALIVLALLGIWPYTRLVHMFSAPAGYLVRPYPVYRSRDPQKASSNRYAKAWVAPAAPPARSRWV